VAEISPEDLEAKLHKLAEQFNAASEPARRRGFRFGIMLSAALVILAYLLGKQRGRLRGTFVLKTPPRARS